MANLALHITHLSRYLDTFQVVRTEIFGECKQLLLGQTQLLKQCA